MKLSSAFTRDQGRALSASAYSHMVPPAADWPRPEMCFDELGSFLSATVYSSRVAPDTGHFDENAKPAEVPFARAGEEAAPVKSSRPRWTARLATEKPVE
jgi:hypothetical protein